MKGNTKCLLTASLTSAMFAITVQNCVHQQRYMLDSIGGAIGVRFQRCQVVHAHLQQLRIFEQRDPHLSQPESNKQESSDVPIKSNRGSGDRGGQETGPPRLSIAPQKCIQVIVHINDEVGMLKPH
ncbi:hypothetical protein AVEN_18059-1 [Araneus ventricosus]|uniref:Uncharacterized protein n=1 Tax=Araneus ventricosus TaxID=182803 RepID=A0A4Y2GZD2_ARAVE|nr:hypothetical protein AVEN_18059-1 [Araneus ventricosus]